MKQVSDFADFIQTAAKQYAERYQKDNKVKDLHLLMMQSLDYALPELAECIDVLLWEADQQAQETIADLDAWHADHEYWTATH